MDRQSKIWGERWLLRTDNCHAISFLDLIKGTRCSWHKHEQKYNLFFLISGSVGIRTEELGGEKRETILGRMECFTVRPGQWHEFRVYENSHMIEEMYVEYDESDIYRHELGGLINQFENKSVGPHQSQYQGGHP